jgi:prevent-host-death family protein
MRVGARELRLKVARVLEEVQGGSDVTITYRNVPVAVIKPLKRKKTRREFKPIGFGMWAGRKDLEDVPGWFRRIRRPRYIR